MTSSSLARSWSAALFIRKDIRAEQAILGCVGLEAFSWPTAWDQRRAYLVAQLNEKVFRWFLRETISCLRFRACQSDPPCTKAGTFRPPRTSWTAIAGTVKESP